MKIKKIAALLLICITVTGCTGRHESVTVKEYQDVTVVPHYTDRIELDYDKSSPRKYLTYCKEYPDLVCRNPGEWYTDDGNPEYPYVIKGQNLDAAEIKAASFIPQSVADRITGRELLDLYARYKYLASFQAYDNWQDGFNMLISDNNAIDLLASRKDCTRTLYDYLIEQADQISPTSSLNEQSLICVVEIMLARNICYNELSEIEREEVVKAARKIHSSVNLFNGKNLFEAAVNNEPYSKWTALVR